VKGCLVCRVLFVSDVCRCIQGFQTQIKRVLLAIYLRMVFYLQMFESFNYENAEYRITLAFIEFRLSVRCVRRVHRCATIDVLPSRSEKKLLCKQKTGWTVACMWSSSTLTWLALQIRRLCREPWRLFRTSLKYYGVHDGHGKPWNDNLLLMSWNNL
jgi:hypothetical protein